MQGTRWDGVLPKTLGNHYNNRFSSAKDVVSKVSPRLDQLRSTTRRYVEILFGSTIPPPIVESAAGRLAVMRSPTMFWSEAGVVLGTEGNGCCPLNCAHPSTEISVDIHGQLWQGV
eukprot:COSAG04_NODE_50_length_31170_cov_2.965080_18_plen_116_part_00